MLRVTHQAGLGTVSTRNRLVNRTSETLDAGTSIACAGCACINAVTDFFFFPHLPPAGPPAPVWDPASTFLGQVPRHCVLQHQHAHRHPLFLVMLLIHPLGAAVFDKLARRAQHCVDGFWANTSTAIF